MINFYAAKSGSYRISFAAPLASGGSLTQSLSARYRGLRLFCLSALVNKFTPLPNKKAVLARPGQLCGSYRIRTGDPYHVKVVL